MNKKNGFLLLWFILFSFIFSGCISYPTYEEKSDGSIFWVPKPEKKWRQKTNNRMEILLQNELDKYPQEYFDIIGDFRIVFGMPYYPWDPQRNGAALFVSPGTIHIYHLEDDYIKIQQFHHEMQHLVEYSLRHNDLYRQQWDEFILSYNELYEQSEIGAFRNVGFLTDYSKKSPAEDRAEIMKYYMSGLMKSYALTGLTYETPLKDYLVEQAKRDEILDKKIILMFTLFKDINLFPALLDDYIVLMGK